MTLDNWDTVQPALPSNPQIELACQNEDYTTLVGLRIGTNNRLIDATNIPGVNRQIGHIPTFICGYV